MHMHYGTLINMIIAWQEFIVIFIVNIIALGIVGFIGYIILRKDIGETISAVVDQFTEIFIDPQVKRSMTILGKESGKVRARQGTVDALALNILDGPRMKGLKMAAKTLLNIDIDSFIEEHGATDTIAGLKEIAGLLGIDISQVLMGEGLNTTTPSSNTTGSYLKG